MRRAAWRRVSVRAEPLQTESVHECARGCERGEREGRRFLTGACNKSSWPRNRGKSRQAITRRPCVARRRCLALAVTAGGRLHAPADRRNYSAHAKNAPPPSAARRAAARSSSSGGCAAAVAGGGRRRAGAAGVPLGRAEFARGAAAGGRAAAARAAAAGAHRGNAASDHGHARRDRLPLGERVHGGALRERARGGRAEALDRRDGVRLPRHRAAGRALRAARAVGAAPEVWAAAPRRLAVRRAIPGAQFPARNPPRTSPTDAPSIPAAGTSSR